MAQVSGYSWPWLRLPMGRGEEYTGEFVAPADANSSEPLSGLTVGSNRVLLHVWSQDDVTLAVDPVCQTLRL